MTLSAQLAAIRGSEQEGFFELRSRSYGGGMRAAFVPLDQPQMVADLVEHAGSDIYIGCAPRVRKSGKAQDIVRLWCVWADCDSEESFPALHHFPIRPTLTIRSGNGLHAWWALREAVEPAKGVALNRRIAAHLGADRVSTDAARILRPVGSQNFKSDPPKLVRVTKRGDQTTYEALDAVVPALERRDASGYVATVWDAPPVEREDGEDLLKQIKAEEYIPRLHPGAEFTRGGKTVCPFHDDWDGDGGSLQAYGTGWTCFGKCQPINPGKQHLGGDIFTFAALILGLPPKVKGAPFLQLVKELEAMFLDPDERTT